MNSLEILYFTDIHDDLKQLRYIVQNSKADLYIFSGDLIYKAFYTEEKLYNFVELQDRLYSYISKNNLPSTPRETALDILKSSNDYDKDILIDAVEYNILYKIASSNMKEKYHTIYDLIKKYAKAPVICLPGNYDMNLKYTSLIHHDMHKKSKIFNNIKFSGYGGAPIVTPGIPENLSVEFLESHNKGKLKSDPLDFFKSQLPEIILTHNPAYGTLDKISSYGNTGSFGIREYIDDYRPALVLSGHVHEDSGLLKTGHTLCLNPSNFGGVDSLHGYTEGGYFCRIYLEKDSSVSVKKIEYLRLKKNQIRPIAMVESGENFTFSEKILNQKEFDIAGGFLR